MKRTRQSTPRRATAPLTYEKKLWADGLRRIAGVDEAGVGPLAGPVIAAAVILPVGLKIAGVNDSKRLTHLQRDKLRAKIVECAIAISIGSCSPKEIDSINIRQAARLAMQRAVVSLNPQPEHVLVDYHRVPNVSVPQRAIVHGDSKSHCIAAASIIAKVHRDTLMEQFAREFPGYGLERHRGYPTRAHVAALRRLGPTSIHRYSFAPVRRAAARLCTTGPEH